MDEQPPECEFFENDKECGEDSVWVMFRGRTIQIMCDAHKELVVANWKYGEVNYCLWAE